MKNKNLKFKKIILGVLGFISIFLFLMASRILNAVGNNLIKNPSVETAMPFNSKIPEGWHKDFFGNNNRVFSYPVAGQDGNNAIKIEIKKYTSGDAKWAFVDVPVTGGSKYEFSDYYQSNVNSYLVARYLNKNGVYRYFDLATLDPADTWTQKKIEITVPNNMVSLTVYHLIKNVGWLTTDNYSLSLIHNSPTNTPVPTVEPTAILTQVPTNIPTTEPTGSPTIEPTVIPTETGIPSPVPTDTVTATPTLVETPVPTIEITPTEIPLPTELPTSAPTDIPVVTPTVVPIPTNSLPSNLGLILNGTLEDVETSTNWPKFWYQGNWGTNSVSFSYPVAGNGSDKAAKVEISSITDGDAKWYFEDISVDPNSIYEFSDQYISDISSRIVARFKLNDGNYSYLEVGSVNPSTTWQTISQTITPPSNAITMTVFHLIDKIGSLTIDNISLNKKENPNALPVGMVSLDFDDGWDSTFKNALPILDNAGLKSTLYIISQYVGEPLYTNVSDILAAQARGHEVGAHSKTHPELPLLSDAQMNEEIGGSRLDLISMGASPVNIFSYPYGEYNEKAISLVKSAGFTSARTALAVDGGFNDKSTNGYLLKTQSVENTTTIEEIQGWIDTAVKNKTWLILVMHQVDNTGSQYSITPQKLQSIVDYLKSNNVKAVTASQGVSILNQ